MIREEYLEFCRNIPGVIVDQPFEEDFEAHIARHAVSRKWFAAVLEHDGKRFVNLKCDPIESEFLRSVYEGIVPGWHMNKTHWITVYFESDVPDELLRQLTMASFCLTSPRPKRRKKGEEV